MTLAALPALAALLALGAWQLDRASQKRALIAAYEATAQEPPLDDPAQAVCDLEAPVQGRRVVPPSELAGAPLRFFDTQGGGPPGWRLLQLTPAPSCVAADYLVVETGFETLEGEGLAPPAFVEALAPPRPNVFTPPNDPGRGDYYRWDAGEFARAFGVGEGAVSAEVWLAAHSGGLPARVADMPPERHVGYAVTWFGLALALVGVYVAYHVRAGRFG